MTQVFVVSGVAADKRLLRLASLLGLLGGTWRADGAAPGAYVAHAPLPSPRVGRGFGPPCFAEKPFLHFASPLTVSGEEFIILLSGENFRGIW